MARMTRKCLSNTLPGWTKTLLDYGKMKHTITYFSYVGHFFGKLINDGQSRMHYDVDKEVLASIKDWLKLNVAEPADNPDAALQP